MKSKLRKTGLFRTSCLSALTPTLRHHFHHHRHKPHTLHTFGGVETQAKEEAFKIAAHSSARRSSQRSTHLDASESELELTGPAGFDSFPLQPGRRRTKFPTAQEQRAYDRGH